MPTYLMNSNDEPIALGYKYEELEEILIPTESYNMKIKEYQEYSDSEGCETIKEAYEGLGCSNTWEEENKSLLLSHMINNKLIIMNHNLRTGTFLYILK